MSKFSSAVTHNVRNASQGFYVVYYRGRSPKSLYCGERRTGTRHTAFALDGVQKCGFFAANECACAESDVYAETEVSSENVVAQQAQFFSLSDCYFKSVYVILFLLKTFIKHVKL